MNKVYAWSNSIKQTVESQKEAIFKRDYKFFKIDRLERIAERIDKYSENCAICDEFKVEIEKLSENAARKINGSPRDRANFEKRNELIVRHLKEKHKLVQRDYFASVYSFVGLAIGLTVFGAAAFLIDISYFIFGMLSGFTIGLITGRILGRSKDKQKEKADLVL